MTSTKVLLTNTTAARHSEMVRDAFGPLINRWITDPSVEDIALNPDGRLWLNREGSAWEEIGEMNAEDALRLIHAVAGVRDDVVNRERPILETELPDLGVRFEGLRPPITEKPAFSIRRFSSRIQTLDEYVDRRILTERQADFILSAIRRRLNILLAGGPGSGKTTMLNMLLSIVAAECPEDRIVTIEDTRELRLSSENTMSLYAKEGLTLLDCLKASLRVRATRLVVGEVRDAEANAMLKAWNTGHPGGLATLHASSAAQALTRLESLVRESSQAVRNAQALIADALQIVVFVSGEKDLDRFPAGRSAREIVHVRGLNGDGYRLEEAVSMG